MQQIKILIIKISLQIWVTGRVLKKTNEYIFRENRLWFISLEIPLCSEVGWTLLSSEQTQFWRLYQVYPVSKSI